MSERFGLDQWMDELDPGMLDEMTVKEITMTEQEIRRVQRRALKKIRRPHLRKKQAALLVAAAVGIAAATATAAESLGGGALFSHYFGGQDLQPGWLDKMCSEPAVSAETDGYRVDLLGVMGDRHSFNAIVDVTAPQGETLTDTARFENSRLFLDGEAGGYSAGWYMTQLEDEDPLDNKARFIFVADANRKMSGKQVTLRLETLQTTGETPQSATYEQSILSDGVWELSFPLEFEDLTRTIRVGERASWKGEAVQIQSVELSPVALRVNLKESLAGLLFDKPAFVDEESAAGEDYDLTLQMKDGTKLYREDFCQMAGEGRELGRWAVSWNFSRLVDISQVESITVMGVEIPVQ